MRQNIWECNAKIREALVDRAFTTEQLQGGRELTANMRRCVICMSVHTER